MTGQLDWHDLALAFPSVGRGPVRGVDSQKAIFVKSLLGASQFCKKTFFAIPYSPFPIPKKR